jgi:hypothetical protein
VSGPAHDAKALAAFQNGEERLVYARYKDRPDDPPYYLEDDTASQVRAWAKEHLECFMPDCTSRRLTTVARTGKRDGFKHGKGAGGHAREGLFHQQAKALIARWVRERWPDVQAVPEQATYSKKRRADVMLTWRDGSQVAVEIQYAPLTPQQWRTRHQSYLDQGVTPVWLFGHTSKHLRQARREPWQNEEQVAGRINLGVLQRAMLDDKVLPLWVNPVDEQIGACWVYRTPHRCLTRGCTCQGSDQNEYAVCVTPREYGEHPMFGTDPLADCFLTPDGITSPTTRRLLDAAAVLRAARQADQARQAAARAEQERRDRREAERQARAEAERQAREAASKAVHEQAAALWRSRERHYKHRWLDSTLRARLIARYGTIPAVLAADLPDPHGIYAHPEHWRTVLYRDLIHDGPPGTRFTVGDTYRALTKRDIGMHSGEHGILAKTVIPFLKHLAEHGIVRIHMKPKSTWEIDTVEVLTDIETAAKAKEERAERVRAEQERRAAQDARLTYLRAKFEARREEQGQPEQAQAEQKAATTHAPTARAAQEKARPWLYEPLPDFHGALGFLTHHLGQHAYQGWHNDVFRACIYQQPPGQALTLDEVYKKARLDEDRLPHEAVRAFLSHVVTARRLDVSEQPETWTIPTTG